MLPSGPGNFLLLIQFNRSPKSNDYVLSSTTRSLTISRSYESQVSSAESIHFRLESDQPLYFAVKAEFSNGARPLPRIKPGVMNTDLETPIKGGSRINIDYSDLSDINLYSSDKKLRARKCSKPSQISTSFTRENLDLSMSTRKRKLEACKLNLSKLVNRQALVQQQRDLQLRERRAQSIDGLNRYLVRRADVSLLHQEPKDRAGACRHWIEALCNDLLDEVLAADSGV